MSSCTKGCNRARRGSSWTRDRRSSRCLSHPDGWWRRRSWCLNGWRCAYYSRRPCDRRSRGNRWWAKRCGRANGGRRSDHGRWPYDGWRRDDSLFGHRCGRADARCSNCRGANCRRADGRRTNRRRANSRGAYRWGRRHSSGGRASHGPCHDRRNGTRHCRAGLSPHCHWARNRAARRNCTGRPRLSAKDRRALTQLLIGISCIGRIGSQTFGDFFRLLFGARSLWPTGNGSEFRKTFLRGGRLSGCKWLFLLILIIVAEPIDRVQVAHDCPGCITGAAA